MLRSQVTEQMLYWYPNCYRYRWNGTLRHAFRYSSRSYDRALYFPHFTNQKPDVAQPYDKSSNTPSQNGRRNGYCSHRRHSPLCTGWLLEGDLQTHLGTRRRLELTFGFPRLCRNHHSSSSVLGCCPRRVQVKCQNNKTPINPRRHELGWITCFRNCMYLHVVCDERISGVCCPKIGLLDDRISKGYLLGMVR